MDVYMHFYVVYLYIMFLKLLAILGLPKLTIDHKELNALSSVRLLN